MNAERHEPGEILTDALLNMPRLAEESGLSLYTIRSITYGKRYPNGRTRDLLAAALKAHAVKLFECASRIEAL